MSDFEGDLGRNADYDPNVTFRAVGEALTVWEHLELNLAIDILDLYRQT